VGSRGVAGVEGGQGRGGHRGRVGYCPGVAGPAPTVDRGRIRVSERSSGQHVQCRPYWARWIAIPVAAVLLGVSVYAATRLQASDTGVDFRVSDQIAMVGLGVVLALVALSPMRPRVRADAEGVSVRNVLFSRRFDWGEVRSVSFPDGASFPRLELAEDEYYSVLAVQAMDRQRAVDAVRGLRRLHRAALSRVAA